MKQIHVKAISLSAGIVWGLGLLLCGWVASTGWCDYFVEVMSSVYIGYAPTFGGGIIGGIWGFVDGAVGGFIFAHLYNYFAKGSKR